MITSKVSALNTVRAGAGLKVSSLGESMVALKQSTISHFANGEGADKFWNPVNLIEL